MDPRRAPRTVSYPKVRQVGFFTAPPDHHHHQLASSASSPPTVTDFSPSGGNSLSPVMIPPPRHSSAPLSPLRQDSLPVVGSFSATDVLQPSASPTATASPSDDLGWPVKGGGGGGSKVVAASSSLPGGGFDMTAAAAKVAPSSVPASGLTTVSVVNLPPGISEKAGGVSVEVQNDQPTHAKPIKEKTTKAERRALQEAQRAAKAAAKGS